VENVTGRDFKLESFTIVAYNCDMRKRKPETPSAASFSANAAPSEKPLSAGAPHAAAPEISQAEWKVMEEVWAMPPQSASAVQANLAGREGWALATVNTLLRRLTAKGALRVEKQGREHWYYPLVAREVCVLRESRSLVDRLFRGRIAPLVAAFVEDESLTEAEIAELRQILDRRPSDPS
jgi:predicted transcriptional regulator